MRARFRQLMYLGGAGLLVAIVVGLYAVDAFRDLELDTVDLRFEVRGDQEPPEDIVFVAIDDRTLSELRERFPFPRSYHGRVIRRLKRDGARTIAYDVVFVAPTEAREDEALIFAVGDAGNVVLGAAEVDARGRSNVFGGEDVVREFNARTGNINVPNDPGGVIRRLPFEVQKQKGFAITTVEEAEGSRIDLGDLPDPNPWIDYHGPPGTIESISFSRVHEGDFRPGFFKDKIVVVGGKERSLQDVHPTSVGSESEMPGPEIQANAISTVLRDFPLKEGPAGLDVAMILLLGLLAPVAGLRFGAVKGAAAGILAALLFAGAAQLAFNSGLIVAALYPLIAAAAGVVAALGTGLVLGAFERERVRDLFGRFVPEAVVDEVLARTDDDLRLGGKRRTVTVLFSDLRGFTSYSETRPPDEVIDVLNRYLSAMTDVIMGHGGTLISYMGDGIMAVFGAPIEQVDHADRAVAAARQMTGGCLESFNDWMREAGFGDGFRMGIGINSGPVMAGNVGSEQRMEYTAIGDTTNTAARLEGMTKGTAHMVFVADSTRSLLVHEAASLVHVDDLEVRGKQARVSVWSFPEGDDGGSR